MKSSDSIAAIAPAWVKAAGDLESVAKDATNPAFRTRYASLDAMMAQVRPVLARHGLAVLQGVTQPETADGRLIGIGIETRLLHTSGEWIASVVLLPVEKPTAQGAGSAITYGRRYGLSTLLGLTADDDDGQAASTASPSSARPAPERIETRAPAPAADAAAGARMYADVPSTPRAKPFDGDVAAALRYPFPFKKNVAHAGKPLGELPMSLLVSTLEWCRKTDADKFADLIGRLDAVIVHLIQAEEDESRPDHNQDESDLPF